MKKTWVIIAAIFLFLGLSLVSFYNNLITQTQAIDNQWAQVETQYQRRFDLIPNLVNSVEGIMAQEQTVFGQIAEARTRYSGATTTEEKVKAATGEPPPEVDETAEKAPPFVFFLIVTFLVFIYSSAFLARSKSFWAGGVLGGVLGAILGTVIGSMIALVLSAIGLGLIGLLLDYILSKNYKKLKKAKKPTSFWRSWGGFSSGGGGGGFGGFGGGSSGGAGASGSW